MSANHQELPTRTLALRAFLLGLNLALIMFAGYLLKPSSRSVFLEYLGAENLAWPWIISALLLLVLMPFYQRLLQRYSRRTVVVASCFTFAAACALLWYNVRTPSPIGALLLYVLVDVIVVVLVEQAWSLIGLGFAKTHSRVWHGLIGSFGIVGAILGGVVAAWLLRAQLIASADLILFAAGVFLTVGLLQWPLRWFRTYNASEKAEPNVWDRKRLTGLVHNKTLLLVVAVLMLGQLAAPFIEFVFLSSVEEKFIVADYRTAYLGIFFSAISTIALLFNLILTPLVHRYLGAAAGLVAQPLAVGVAASGIFFMPGLYFAELLKLSERSLSYSITRASKELLYLRANIRAIFTIKSWLDIVGYRLFKLLGSVGLLVTVQFLSPGQSRYLACGVIITLSVAWIVCVLLLELSRRKAHNSGEAA